MLLIKNGKVLYDQQLLKGDLLIDEGKIVAFNEHIDQADVQTLDAEGLYVLPGLIDVHVHLREPGYEKKETIKTGTMAALKGGFTTICPMPNILPYPDNAPTMKAYLALIKREAQCHVYPYGTLTIGEKGEKAVDFQALKELGIKHFSDDGVGIADAEVMKEVLKKAKAAKVMTVMHTEDMHYRPKDAVMHEGQYSKEKGLIGIADLCEAEALKRDLSLLAKDQKYHACHISSKKSVEALAQAKKAGYDVSGEVTAHHLLLEDKDFQNSNHKMNPPLRSHEDRLALIKGLEDGILDFIASDHAPHTQEEKARDIISAPFGIVSLETSLAVLYTEFVKKEGRWTLNKLIDWMAHKPAERFGFIHKGLIKEGYDADIILVDFDHEYTIKAEDFVSKGHNTPFDKQKVYGKVICTVLNGQIKWKGSL